MEAYPQLRQCSWAHCLFLAVGYVACTQILKESLLIRAQWEVAKLAQLHPPKLINANKRLVYNLICPKVGLDAPAAFGSGWIPRDDLWSEHAK